MLTLRFDGLYRPLTQEGGNDPHAGVMCYGWVISRNGKPIARGHGGYMRRTDASSNIAEYLGLIEGLEALLDMGAEQEAVEIIGDARSVIDQMIGRAGVNSASTRPLYRRAQRLASRFRRLLWTWTPRRKNHAADQLTRRAMKQIRANARQYQNAIQTLEMNYVSGRSKNFFPLLNLMVYQPGGLRV